MKIVFPILRMNWYRVVSTTIEAALEAGHAVECWHFIGGHHYAANRPDVSRVPAYRCGAPRIREFTDDDAFLALLREHQPEALVSISVPWTGIVRAFAALAPRPLWVALTTNDTFAHTNEEEILGLCDLIALRSAHERECVVRDHTADVRDVLRRMEREPRTHGRMFPDLLAKRAAHPWTPEMCAHFHARSVVTGYPLLDSIVNLDRAAIRERWGIPRDQPVVACLASPYGSVLEADWERAFASPTPWGRLYWNVRWRGLAGLWRPAPNEAEVMRAIGVFSKRNGAFTITKMRHSQDATPAIRRASNLVLGEEGYYPHTAVEMQAVADVVFGFFTTGAPEAVAAGARFIEIRIPGYNRYVWECASSQFLKMFDRPGASWSISAEAWIREANSKTLSDFPATDDAMRAYRREYCGPMDGRHSARLVRAIERMREGSMPADWPTDEQGVMKP